MRVNELEYSLIDLIGKSKTLTKLEGMKEGKIAFLSSFTIKGLPESLKCQAHKNNLFIQTFEGPYNQYIQEIINEKSNLYAFAPDVIFINIALEDFLAKDFDFFHAMDNESKNTLLNNKKEFISSLISTLKKFTNAKIIFSNFLIPTYTNLGISEIKEVNGLKNWVINLNNWLEKVSLQDNQILIHDINRLFLLHGKKTMQDHKMKYLADMKISAQGLVKLSEDYLCYLIPAFGLTKKVIVLDLDNTLWGGIIGEDGVSKIKLGPDKEGSPFLDFQKKLLELSSRGIILAINSKNNEADALNVIRNHEFMVLKENNFAAKRINWNDKASNMLELSKELNLGLDSFVFFDDDITNRELIRKMLPQVTVVDLPNDPSEYCQTLEDLPYFNLFSITEDDKKRSKMYLDESNREIFKQQIGDLDSFLKQLEIKVVIKNKDVSNIDRISQLTMKTNQFNLTTRRYLEEKITAFISDSSYKILSITVSDKFGDYGLTGVVIIKSLSKKEWNIDTFLLSCRVLGKNVEFAIMNSIVKMAQDQNIELITAEFIKSEKNKPCENFYEECKFILNSKSDEIKKYSINPLNYIMKKVNVEVIQ